MSGGSYRQGGEKRRTRKRLGPRSTPIIIRSPCTASGSRATRRTARVRNSGESIEDWRHEPLMPSARHCNGVRGRQMAGGTPPLLGRCCAELLPRPNAYRRRVTIPTIASHKASPIGCDCFRSGGVSSSCPVSESPTAYHMVIVLTGQRTK